MVPEFADDSEQKEVKETAVEETVEEKETPPETDEVLPPEQETVVTEQKPAPKGDDGNDLEKQLHGLQQEKAKLLSEIQNLRGQRREIKKEELIKVNDKIDDLKDVNPADIDVIDKVLRSKGYLTKEESQKMFYESVKQEQIGTFLEKYPEYKPENDPHDVNWNTLQREFSIYAMPSDPKLIGDRLERAHRGITRSIPDRTIEVKKQQIKTAGVGSGGTQRSSSAKTLDPDKRAMLERGGWSDEDISRIESNL